MSTMTTAIVTRAKRKASTVVRTTVVAEPAPMTSLEAEQAITRINVAAEDFTVALIGFAQREGWKALGYPSIRHCLAERLKIGTHSVHQILVAAQTRYELATMAGDERERKHLLGLSNNATLTLRRLQDPRRRLEAYRSVMSKVGANGNGRAVGIALSKAVRRLAGIQPSDVRARTMKCPRCQGSGRVPA